MLFSNFVPLKA